MGLSLLAKGIVISQLRLKYRNTDLPRAINESFPNCSTPVIPWVIFGGKTRFVAMWSMFVHCFWSLPPDISQILVALASRKFHFSIRYDGCGSPPALTEVRLVIDTTITGSATNV